MKRARVILLTSALSCPSLAQANAGIPMLVLAWPLLGLAFFPVVALEAALLARAFGLPFKDTLRPVAVANLWSTLVGVPLTWLALLVLAILVATSAYVLPDRIGQSKVLGAILFPLSIAWIAGDAPYELPLAFTLLMIVFAVVSAHVELKVLAERLPELPARELKLAVVRFNALSYVLLAAIAVGGFTVAA